MAETKGYARALLWAALALIPITALLTQRAERPPAAKSVTAPADQFSGQRAKLVLQALLGDGAPHPLGSTANASVRARIVQQFEQLGYRPEEQSHFMACDARGGCGVPTNIVARLEGTAGDAGAVLLSAHYDSVAAGPGASDDGAGVAAVLEIARILKRAMPLRHSIIFLIDDGEEAGLLGAEVFARHHRWANSVVADVNLEARGTSGASFMFETGSANAWLMSLYAGAEARPIANSVYYTGYKSMPNDTDFTVFKAAGWQGFNFAFIGDASHYHTPLDDAPHASPESIQDQGERALVVLRALANDDAARAQAGESEYFDILGRVLVRVPVSAARTLTLIALFSALLLIGVLLRRGSLSMRSLLSGLAVLLLAPGLAALYGWLLQQLLSSQLGRGGGLSPVAHPWAPELAFFAGAFALIAALAAAVRTRVGSLGLAAATVLWGLIGASALAWWLPGVSYPLFWSAAAALLALAVAVVCARGSVVALGWANLLHVVVAFLLLWPLLLPLYSALGADGLARGTVVLLLVAGGLMGLLAGAATADRRLVLGLSVLLTLIGAVATLLLPRYSSEVPRRLDLAYELDSNRARARWLLDAAFGPPPSAFSQLRAMATDPSATPRPPPFALAFGSEAPTLAFAAPELLVLAVDPVDGDSATRSYRLQVRSARGAPKLWLALPASTDVRRLTLVPGTHWDPDIAAGLTLRPARRGWFMVSLEALPPEGAIVGFASAAHELDLALIDQSYGLPSAGAALQRLRPRDTVPWQDGDVTLVLRQFHIADGALVTLVR